MKQSYLPGIKPEYKYTLVLDLDETLVHYDEENECFYVRPFATEFLENMHKYYEIVVFTAATQDYADYILDLIDKRGLISYRLYRHHATQQNDVYIKDLSKLNRNLDKIIIVDNTSDNFKLHP